MFFRDAEFPQRGNSARIFAYSPPDIYRGEPCPFAKITPFKTSFGFFMPK